MRKIASVMGYSKNTVRKIVYRIDGYEREAFNHNRWKGGQYRSEEWISEVDGELLHIQRTVDGRYPRITVEGKRSSLHIREAQKVFVLAKREWPRTAVVHHINHITDDLSLSNLVVFRGTGEHLAHHGRTESAMYAFLYKRGLLDDFYMACPDVKPETLEDILAETKKKAGHDVD